MAEERRSAVEGLYERLAHVPRRDAASRAGDQPTTIKQRSLIKELGHVPPHLMMASLGVTLNADVDVESLSSALQMFAERHDGTRTAFPTVGGDIVQRVAWPAALEVRMVDATRGGLEEAGAALDADMARGVTLATGPLIRILLARIAPRKLAMYLIGHHIVIDGRSIELFLSELPTLYGAVRAGKPNPLRPVLQSSDIAHWEQTWYEEEFPKCSAFWKSQILDREFPLSMRSMRRPPPDQRFFQCSRLSASINIDEQVLWDFATARDTTIAVVTLAAFKAVLCIEQDLKSVTVGVISANRRTQTIRMFGLFATHLPLRTELDPGMSFNELLRRVDQNLKDAQDHEHIAHNIAVPPSPNEPLRFRAFFNCQRQQRPSAGPPAPSSDTPAQSADTLVLSAFGTGTTDSQMMRDLDLTISQQSNSQAHLTYNNELIDQSDARDLLERYVTMLRSAIREPERAFREFVPQSV
jgi:hypothetical protein